MGIARFAAIGASPSLTSLFGERRSGLRQARYCSGSMGGWWHKRGGGVADNPRAPHPTSRCGARRSAYSCRICCLCLTLPLLVTLRGDAELADRLSMGFDCISFLDTYFELDTVRAPICSPSRLVQGCTAEVSVRQRILQLRGLVLTPEQDIHAWMQFASLCRVTKNFRLSRKVGVCVQYFESALSLLGAPMPSKSARRKSWR